MSLSFPRISEQVIPSTAENAELDETTKWSAEPMFTSVNASDHPQPKLMGQETLVTLPNSSKGPSLVALERIERHKLMGKDSLKKKEQNQAGASNGLSRKNTISIQSHPLNFKKAQRMNPISTRKPKSVQVEGLELASLKATRHKVHSKTERAVHQEDNNKRILDIYYKKAGKQPTQLSKNVHRSTSNHNLNYPDLHPATTRSNSVFKIKNSPVTVRNSSPGKTILTPEPGSLIERHIKSKYKAEFKITVSSYAGIQKMREAYISPKSQQPSRPYNTIRIKTDSSSFHKRMKSAAVS